MFSPLTEYGQAKEVMRVSYQTKKTLISVLTNVFSSLASLVIAMYAGEIIIDITLPVWVHWIMPFVVVNWVRAIDA